MLRELPNTFCGPNMRQGQGGMSLQRYSMQAVGIPVLLDNESSSTWASARRAHEQQKQEQHESESECKSS